ncbi:MAG: cyclase family protein [Dehalococcoidia bacterium]|nr:cyclase family protein [Dehalococcoidia bacterium]
MAIIDEYAQKYRNWGRWGSDDQRGTANYVTAEMILGALQLPKKGRVISLAMPFDASGPQTGRFGRINPVRQMLATGTDHAEGRQLFEGKPFPHGFGYADDTLFMPIQCGTQWDGLSHIFHDGKMWNGYEASDVTAAGASRNGIEKLKESLTGRGVLLDVARYKGVDCLDRGYGITIEDLDGTARKQGVEVREGDILLVRTGELGRCQVEGWDGFAGGDAPGVSFYTAPWIHERKIAALATDTWGVEVRPNELPNSFQPLHIVALVNGGLLLGEMFALDELAEACAEDGTYEFLLVAPPLPLTGAVGSPLNPVAIK